MGITPKSKRASLLCTYNKYCMYMYILLVTCTSYTKPYAFSKRYVTDGRESDKVCTNNYLPLLVTYPVSRM